jgi:aspartate/methionine/tyrosine aminotransferase
MFENPEIPDALPFTSILALDLEEDIDRSLLHMAYGASKDFCANGLRLGMIYSKNEGLIGSMASVA